MPSIVVCVRFCPDVSQVAVDATTRAPRLEEVPWRISTFDEHALEAAVLLKEAHGGAVTALCLVDREPPRELVLKILAMGADLVCLAKHPLPFAPDALLTATLLAQAIGAQGPPELIVCGEASLDRFDQQVGPRLAEALGWPSLTYAARLELREGLLVADRILEERLETVECPLPALVTVGQESPAPRMPSVLQILGAGRKPVKTVEVTVEEAVSAARAEQVAIAAPAALRRGQQVSGEDASEVASKLARILWNEGVVRP